MISPVTVVNLRLEVPPTEDKPTLEKTARNVFCGNEQGIRISGIAYMPIKLQQIEYQAAFHVSPDVQKGILGSDFLERYDAHVQVARRKLLFILKTDLLLSELY